MAIDYAALKAKYPKVVDFKVDVAREHIHIVANDGYANNDVNCLIDEIITTQNFDEDKFTIRLSEPV